MIKYSTKDAKKAAYNDMMHSHVHTEVFNLAKAIREYPKEDIIPLSEDKPKSNKSCY